jgi:MFS family permease
MLTERERDFIMARSVRLTAGLAREEATKWPLIIRGFTSIHVWLGIVPWFVAQILASSLTFFLAAILRQDFGYSARQSNLHVAYTFFFSFGMTPILGYCADRSKIHAPWILFSTCLALMGSCMFSYSTNQNARYAGACVVCGLH